MYDSRITWVFGFAVCLSTAVIAEEEQYEAQRHHEAHLHGTGQINIAIEKDTLMVELSMPAMNVVGFEHAPRDKQQHTMIEKAANNLERGVVLFGPSPAAGCRLTDVHIASTLLEKHHDDHPYEAEHEHEAEHADFDAIYQFKCRQASQLNSLSLTLFDYFPGNEQLNVQVITSTGQQGGQLTADNPVIRLQ